MADVSGLILRTMLAGALVAATYACGGQKSDPRLGPKDGHDLPATDLERVAVGDVAPDFALRALSGDVLTLSDFRRQKNVVLVFYRGHW